jgi:drug/metabolite transporter (DMT)-like permease
VTHALSRRPGAAAVAGALTIAFSAILVKLADVEPSTAAIFRCAYALPVLGLLAALEDRRHGRRPTRERRLAIPAGIFFAADLILWHHAIADVGAGLATVLGNMQVVVVPFAAWAVLGERIEARLLAALPLVCSGVVLISGVLETGAYGEHPVRGVVFGILTGLTYGGFLLVLRQSGADLRRLAGPLFDATLVATVVAVIAGLALGEADLVPSWPAHAWLLTLALTSQVLGWLLIASSLPRLPAALTSVTLTIQPVGSVLLGIVLLGEEPSGLQIAGVACILAGLLAIARRRAPVLQPA